jgi:hypothetical protein
MAYPKASLTVRLDVPSHHRWSGTFPIEVRDCAKLVLTARGFSDGKFEVPAGRYFVTALLPNGQQVTVDDIVELQPGEDKQVELSVTNLDFPATLQNTTTFGDSVKQFVRPVSQLFASQSVAIIRGSWLKTKIQPDSAPPVAREPTTRASIKINFPEVNTWVEIADSRGCTYLAVPVDENRSTTMQWALDPDAEKLELKFDFNDGELNSFFDFIQNDQALQARSIGHSIIKQSEQYMMEKRRSPLRAILGAYVLLRANELDGMDMWTRNFVSWCNWLPDALAVRVEYLARNAEHAAALQLLLDVPKWGTPWFRSGIGYLEKRAKLYANVAAGKRSGFQVSDDDLKRMQRIAVVFSEFAAALDMAHPTTVLRDMPRIA